MIDVFIRRSGGHYSQFYVRGHAGYAEYGKDIVCAAVSALTITLENALSELSDVPIMEKTYVREKNTIIFIPTPSDKTDLLIEMYKLGIESAQESYPDYVKLHLET
mgnify:FL=1